MYRVQDWAEVHRLFEREGWSKTAIAVKLGMSRNTVDRLLELDDPPVYRRPPKGSALDSFVGEMAAMLEENPRVAATVILERLRPLGYSGGITVLKDRLAQLRPAAVGGQELSADQLSARGDLPAGLVAHGSQIPVGTGATREAFGLVATLPQWKHS